MLDQLGVVIERHVKRRAVGTFTLPGLLKIKVVRKPATKARKMISPFTDGSGILRREQNGFGHILNFASNCPPRQYGSAQ